MDPITMMLLFGTFGPAIGQLFTGRSSQQRLLDEQSRDQVQRGQVFDQLLQSLLEEARQQRTDQQGRDADLFGQGGAFPGGFSFGRDGGISNPLTGENLGSGIADKFAASGVTSAVPDQQFLQQLMQITNMVNPSGNEFAPAQAAGQDFQRQSAIGSGLGSALGGLQQSFFLQKILEDLQRTAGQFVVANPATNPTSSIGQLPGVLG